MKKKRLNRDGWGFHYFPYYQLRIDTEEFRGLACVLKIVEGDVQRWEMPKSGPIAVCGKGMTWLQLVPDGKKRVITVKYFSDGDVDPVRKNYPEWARKNMCPSIWYVDVIEKIEYDNDGVAVFTDKYLDVIFSPEGDIKVDDRDELDAAYATGDITKEQYEEALLEGDEILEDLCKDIKATGEWCAKIKKIADKMIADGHKPMYLFHGSKGKYDKLEPQKANGQCEKEALLAVYAGESLRDVIPFAVPIRAYPDAPGGNYSFSCDAGEMKVEYGYVDIKGEGYVYRVKPDTFSKVDEWEWVSNEPVEPLEVLTIPADKMMHKVTFSEKAREIQDRMCPL